MLSIHKIFAAFVLCAACGVVAGNAEAASVADRFRDKYATIDALRADFTQVLIHKESGSKEQRSGVISFKKPLLLRWETRSPDPELLIVGKEAVWNAFPDEEIAYKYSLDLARDSRSIAQVISGQVQLSEDFYVEDKGTENGALHLVLYPKEPAQSMVEARLWLAPDSLLIQKIRVYDFFGNENEISFSRHEPGASLPDKQFSYTPPGGWIVEDKTRDQGAAPKSL